MKGWVTFKACHIARTPFETQSGKPVLLEAAQVSWVPVTDVWKEILFGTAVFRAGIHVANLSPQDLSGRSQRPSFHRCQPEETAN